MRAEGTPSGSKSAAALRALVERVETALADVEVERFAHRERPGGWSATELLGHLVDSASNNHQRFVRAAFVDHLDFPGYDQDEWVRLQAYGSADPRELLALFAAFNRHIAHVLGSLPSDVLERPRAHHALDRIAFERRPADEPVTLAWFASDYVVHLRHHLVVLGRILGREDLVRDA